ncbi:hypothetical protein FHS89_003214, partial [Rubricella aquisinus]|nr:hypothetical protein [Rubricella aquisinus]
MTVKVKGTLSPIVRQGVFNSLSLIWLKPSSSDEKAALQRETFATLVSSG